MAKKLSGSGSDPTRITTSCSESGELSEAVKSSRMNGLDKSARLRRPD
jgi:hypothetical protein